MIHVPRTAVLALLLAGCSSCGSGSAEQSTGSTTAGEPGPQPAARAADDGELATREAPPLEEGLAEAIFAGGCFWCMEAPFDRLDGVGSTTSGYTGGSMRGPSYGEVSSGRTGHAEAVRVVYDPERISYEELLEVFWHNVDPTQEDGQFCDHGPQYRTAIFVSGPEERELAEASRARVAEELGDEIVTEIVDASPFWVAEDYHQDYYRTHPTRYRRYRQGCGRDRRLEDLWGTSGH